MPSTSTDRLFGLTTSVAVKAACRVCTSSNITLSGLQTIDGVSVAARNRVLVKSQTDATENGIYLAQSGVWVRAPDFDGSLDVVGGTIVMVTSGTINAKSFWQVAGYGDLTVGSDEINFEATSGNLSLQSDLAANGGAAMIGTSRGSTVEDELTDIMADAVTAQDETTSLIDSYRRALAIEQAARLPYEEIGDVFVGQLLPSSTYPVVALRLHEDWILVRVRNTELAGAGVDPDYWTEYVLRDPNGYPASDSGADTGVQGGWQVVQVRTFVNGRYITWFVSPNAPGSIPNADFAIRIGLMADAYTSSGDTGDWRYRGYGHGGMLNTPGNNSITVDGGGTNYQSTGTWAVGTTLSCTANLAISMDFTLILPPKTYGNNPFATDGSTGVVTVTHAAHGLSSGATVVISGATAVGGITADELNEAHVITVLDINSYTIPTAGTSTSATSGGGASAQHHDEGVLVDYVLTFQPSVGLRRYLRFEQSGDNANDIGVQDSYHVLFGVSPIDVNRFKPNGLNAGTITRDGTVKSDSQAWHSGAASIYQAYSSIEPTIQLRVTDEYGQPVRASDASLSAFEWNNFARRFYNDLPDFPKFYAPFASSEEGLPRTAWQLDPAIYYECQTIFRGVYDAGGPD